jgi:hypothetical protein
MKAKTKRIIIRVFILPCLLVSLVGATVRLIKNSYAYGYRWLDDEQDNCKITIGGNAERVSP